MSCCFKGLKPGPQQTTFTKPYLKIFKNEIKVKLRGLSFCDKKISIIALWLGNLISVAEFYFA